MAIDYNSLQVGDAIIYTQHPHIQAVILNRYEHDDNGLQFDGWSLAIDGNGWLWSGGLCRTARDRQWNPHPDPNRVWAAYCAWELSDQSAPLIDFVKGS